MPPLFIGLMSGTSLDGVDGVLAQIQADAGTAPVRVLSHAARPLPDTLAAELLALNTPDGRDELHRAALAANALVRIYAAVVDDLLRATGVAREAVRAIGAHGQTVRHQPGPRHEGAGGTGYTLQLNNPALLVELTGITVVADFRSRDVAAGGQGAPLVPAFHQAVFGRGIGTGESVAVLNIGGMANLSLLQGEAVGGFDCGPGNALLDAWCQLHQGEPYDAGGRWAASGQVNAALLRDLLDEPYFQQSPPKSTGRDLFHSHWLQAKLAPHLQVTPVDVQATLTELTALSCATDLLRHAPTCRTLYVCGGGALNDTLMQGLRTHLPGMTVSSTDAAGLPPLQVEAAAFAWLARQCLAGETGNLTRVTGARQARVLGAIYPV
ncbi:anhydro-N-acetylmuramic acid kinase [Hylemonella gracilis str. Niagara R]|uniref:Anhydro-N-acetylmuramic acid kinase n=1 Tax=Hylemonella gracilis str. Niagara R TaxID=1458275 RepID=A0A016XE86_9BURK|nr:anhydro-N-acetylmuramic acid kinase [Hylemonella gracilis]EYC50220.1 anhydro-N-acetylmuramic acid kinase [Hylemonella gracilis str. Niagara R]